MFLHFQWHKKKIHENHPETISIQSLKPFHIHQPSTLRHRLYLIFHACGSSYLSDHKSRAFVGKERYFLTALCAAARKIWFVFVPLLLLQSNNTSFFISLFSGICRGSPLFRPGSPEEFTFKESRGGSRSKAKVTSHSKKVWNFSPLLRIFLPSSWLCNVEYFSFYRFLLPYSLRFNMYTRDAILSEWCVLSAST